MSIRRDTKNRLTLYRTCFVCGREFTTTADSPFMRQMPNVDGKKQKTVYFCSESCKQSTYKHLFDGKAAVRKAERYSTRDIKAKNYKYYHAHEDAMRERRRRQYYSMTQEDRDKENEYRRKRRAAMKGDAKPPERRRNGKGSNDFDSSEVV